MKTYVYSYKNSSAGLILSAEDEYDAEDQLKVLVHNPDNWRLDHIEDEDRNYSKLQKSQS